MLQKEEEQVPQSIGPTIEDSIYYNMYKEEKAENKVLIEEIGALKERIKQLEGELKKPASDAPNSNIANAV